jgi:uncharacterized protein (DUF952 family)
MVEAVRVYRICEATAWATARATGELPCSELDRRDGYLHLSSAEQVPGTLARYFAGRGDLVLLSIDSDRIDGTLRFEPPSGRPSTDELFPHVYGRIPLAAVIEAEPLQLDEHGVHRPPAILRP